MDLVESGAHTLFASHCGNARPCPLARCSGCGVMIDVCGTDTLQEERKKRKSNLETVPAFRVVLHAKRRVPSLFGRHTSRVCRSASRYLLFRSSRGISGLAGLCSLQNRAEDPCLLIRRISSFCGKPCHCFPGRGKFRWGPTRPEHRNYSVTRVLWLSLTPLRQRQSRGYQIR